MINKLLIAIGLKSSCCAAKIKNWHYNRYYCSDCGACIENGKPTQEKCAPAEKSAIDPASNKVQV